MIGSRSEENRVVDVIASLVGTYQLQNWNRNGNLKMFVNVRCVCRNKHGHD